MNALKNNPFRLLALSMTLFASATVWAGPTCTEANQSEWKNAEAFQADLVKQGYTIKKFKVTKGNCYEIYGHNAEGKKVEIYFDPVTGNKVKEEIDD